MDPDQSDELVVALRHAAQRLDVHHSIYDLEVTLAQIVASAVDTVPGVDAGSISLCRGGLVETRHPTSREIEKLDRAQSDLDEGPCMTALNDPAGDGVVLARDLAGDDALRWPRFAPRAVESGYRSLMSTQLSADEHLRAALNLYSAAPNAFDEQARRVAGLFGVQAALMLYGSHHASHLSRALETRLVIEQAKGYLARHHRVSPEEAFRILRAYARGSQRRLTAVADDVVRRGLDLDCARGERDVGSGAG
ncbi:GAF and ANTAR domain-containing protein [Actinomycetospora sp. CA-053990]|uniref:GAF and ANTAR domain-containing protein n=1 Tax=Actinomycetospora sp. CA-053990 TaxID=3239891 RepID=UPI003D8F155D